MCLFYLLINIVLHLLNPSFDMYLQWIQQTYLMGLLVTCEI